ncbi:MAG: prefoldin subunit [Candidatus Hadarchaeota archaeon]
MQPNPSNLPPQAQEMIEELQERKKQLQQINEQRNRFKFEQKRTEKALEAINNAEEEKEVFKVVGPVGIKSTQKELKEELSEDKDKIEAKLSSMGKKEEKIREEAEGKQQKLREMMSGGKTK